MALPDDRKPDVEPLLNEGESLLLLTETDITRDDRFGHRWLAVTDRRVMTFADDGAEPSPEIDLVLEDIVAVRSTHRVGAMVVEAETDGRRVELLRCTNSLSGKFSKIAKAMTDAREADRVPEFDLSDEDERHCQQCGRLLPERGSFCPACLKKHQVLARIWRYVRPYWPRFALILILIISGTILLLVPPYLVGVLVDDVLLGPGGAAMLTRIVALLVGVGVAGMAISIGRGRLSAWLGSRVAHEIRFDVFQAIQGLTLRRHDKTQTGALMSRLTHDTSMLMWMFTDAGILIVPALMLLLAIPIVLLALRWWLALLALLPAPLVIALMGWFIRRLHSLYHRVWQRRSRMGARANDSIAGIRVVKAFSQEPREVDHFGERSGEMFLAAFRAEGMWATGFPAIALLIALGTYLVWYFGGMDVLKDSPGGLTVGGLIRFIHYLAMFYAQVRMVAHYGNHLNSTFAAAQRLFEITDADQEVYEGPHARALHDVEGAIKFDSVHFGYVKDRPVLKGVSIDVKPGEMIGLVGRSGVGKTTMTNLICRFYDPDEGAILLDNVDLRQIRLRDLRRHIGIVPQEPYLFNGSIAENIAYAKADATKEEVVQAAIAANAHGFIMRQPDGYDTVCGDRGSRLSAGEKQRVAIARAILHNPAILILDEATSSVDTETEAMIQTALARLVEGRTTFAIAHRLSTLRNASRLIVLDEGKPAEIGTHDELMRKKGVYHRLVEMQSKLSAMKAVDG
jgi:ATP-binding cassette subfamily B protein